MFPSMFGYDSLSVPPDFDLVQDKCLFVTIVRNYDWPSAFQFSLQNVLAHSLCCHAIISALFVRLPYVSQGAIMQLVWRCVRSLDMCTCDNFKAVSHFLSISPSARKPCCNRHLMHAPRLGAPRATFFAADMPAGRLSNKASACIPRFHAVLSFGTARTSLGPRSYL